MTSATGNRTTETALNRIHFNEYGDYLDKPYVVRCIKTFDVNRSDGDGFIIEGETYTVEEGSVWEIYCPSYENDVSLTEVTKGNVYSRLDLNWDDLALFELLEEGGYYE